MHSQQGDDTPPKRKVLVIEDDKIYCRFLTLQLNALGFTCHSASTHVEALRQLTEDPEIGIVLLDYDLNGSGPDAFVEQLASIQRPLCIVGHSSLNRSEKFAALGIREFFKKPLRTERFVQIVDLETC